MTLEIFTLCGRRILTNEKNGEGTTIALSSNENPNKNTLSTTSGYFIIFDLNLSMDNVSLVAEFVELQYDSN